MIEQNITTKSRLLAKIVRSLLAEESFETLADLTDALKWRCVKLNIRFTNDELNYAYTLIESNHALTTPQSQPVPEVVAEPRLTSRTEAVDLCNQLPLGGALRVFPRVMLGSWDRRRVDRE